MKPGAGGTLRESARLAVLGRFAFVAALLLVLFASFFGGPRLFVSSHVQHFAGFYALALATAAGMKRAKVINLGYGLAGFAVLVEAVRLALGRSPEAIYMDWLGDAAGVIAALGPMLLQKIRTHFSRAP